VGAPAATPLLSLRLTLVSALTLALLRADRPADALEVVSTHMRLFALVPAVSAPSDGPEVNVAYSAGGDAVARQFYPLSQLAGLSGRALFALATLREPFPAPAVPAAALDAAVVASAVRAASAADPVRPLERALAAAAVAAVRAAATAKLSEETAAWEARKAAAAPAPVAAPAQAAAAALQQPASGSAAPISGGFKLKMTSVATNGAPRVKPPSAPVTAAAAASAAPAAPAATTAPAQAVSSAADAAASAEPTIVDLLAAYALAAPVPLSSITGLPAAVLPDAAWLAAEPVLSTHGVSPLLLAAGLRAHSAAIATALRPAAAARAAVAASLATSDPSPVHVAAPLPVTGGALGQALATVTEAAAAILAPASPAAASTAAPAALVTPWQVQVLVDAAADIHDGLTSAQAVLALAKREARAAHTAALASAGAPTAASAGAEAEDPAWNAPFDPSFAPASLMTGTVATAAAAVAAADPAARGWGPGGDTRWGAAGAIAKKHICGAGGLSVTGSDAAADDGDDAAPVVVCPAVHVAATGPRVPVLALALGSPSVANRSMALSLSRVVFQDASLPTGHHLPAAGSAGSHTVAVPPGAAKELSAHGPYHATEALIALATLLEAGDPVSAEGLFRGAAREAAKMPHNSQGNVMW
jgi:hypothetical protein